MTPTPSPTPIPSSTPSPTPTPTVTPTRPPSPTPSIAPARTPPVAFLDGTHRVPQDIAPGIYRTTTYTTDCYWTRLRGFESGLEDIIASRIGSGYQVVTIGRRDAGFDSVGCGAWTADLSPVTESRDEFGEGTYIVGTDVAAGRFRASDGIACDWARLSGFGGTRRHVIDRDSVDSDDPPTVEIEPTDAGFTSSGCGIWMALDSEAEN